MTTPSRTVTWTPPAGRPGQAITFDQFAPFVFVDLEGAEAADVSPVSARLVGQAGETALNVDAQVRVLTLKAGLIGQGPAELAAARRTLARSLAIEPKRIEAARQEVGLFTYTQPGGMTVEIPALPRGGWKRTSTDDTRTLEEGSIEFWCPTPWWRATEDVEVDFDLTTGTGFWFTDGDDELAFPWSSVAGAASAIALNPGDVSAPIVVRLHGDFTTGTILNATTGERITIADQVMADEYVEISTEPGNRYVDLVNPGEETRVSILDRVDLETATFWQLPPGESVLVFTMETQVSGFPLLSYRPRFTGV